jgi:hypothetical protein
MKYLKSYKRFKNTNKFNESVVFSVKTISSIVTPQVNKAIESLGDVKPDSVIKWVKSTLMNPKSGTFLLKNMIEELKANGSFLPKGYSGSSSESVATQFDYNDLNYYRFIQGVFDSEYGVLADPDDIKNNKVNFMGEKNLPTNCGLFFIQQIFQKKFGNDKVPYMVVEYCIKRIRKDVAQRIKYVSDNKRPDFIDEFQPRAGGEKDIKVEDEKIPPGCFKEEGPTSNIPELKQILIKCGGRDIYKKDISPADEKKILLPIAQKKRLAFYNWFTGTVYSTITKVLNEINESDVTESLKNQGIDTDSGKIVYKVDDKVVYLRKDKTIEEWNKLKDFQKQNLKESPASDIVSTGKVTEVEGDNIKIEYKEGEFTNKTSDEIIKKIKESEKEEEPKEVKEEDKKKEEEVKEEDKKEEEK